MASINQECHITDKNTFRRILQYLEGAAILQNPLVEVDDDVPSDWIVDADFSYIEGPSLAEFDDDHVDQAIPIGAL